MKYLTIFITLLVFSCGRTKTEKSVAEEKKVKSDKENPITDSEQKDTNVLIDEIKGDFDGDGIVDVAMTIKVKEGNGNPVDGGTPDEYEIKFNNKKIKTLNIGCCSCRLINEGDLNNDGSDEISVFQEPMNGCTYNLTTYTFENGEWKVFIETFLVPTACNNFSDEELQNRIFKEGNNIYFYETDANSEDWDLIKKKARTVSSSKSRDIKAYFYETEYSFEGELDTIHKYGPPGYGENPNIDKIETIFLMKTDSFFCIKRKEDQESYYQEVESISSFQIVGDVSGFSDKIGQEIKIKGSFTFPITGHHHTKVIFQL